MVTDVSATRGASGVIVAWRDIYSEYDAVTYRIYRRFGTSADWARIAEIDLDQTSLRQHVDASPPSTRLDYAVTMVGECGETPLCTLVNAGEECTIASVSPATKEN